MKPSRVPVSGWDVRDVHLALHHTVRDVLLAIHHTVRDDHLALHHTVRDVLLAIHHTVRNVHLALDHTVRAVLNIRLIARPSGMLILRLITPSVISSLRLSMPSERY